MNGWRMCLGRTASRAAGPFLLCGVAALLWTTPARAAEPNATRASSTRPAVAPAKPGKVTSPAPKLKATPAAPDSPASAPEAVTPPAEPSDGNSILTDRLRSQLWRSRILPPDPNEDALTRAALQDLIQRLKTVGTEQPPEKRPLPKPILVEAPAVTPKNTDAAPAPAEQPGPLAAPEPAGPNEVLSPAALQRLNDLVKDPNQVPDPLEMAELLFLNNRPIEAAVFYEKALALTRPNDPATSDDRAWILFQLATSLRQTSTSRAKDIYLKLISEFPNGPWTELAKANGRLLSWYESTKPQQLIAAPTP